MMSLTFNTQCIGCIRSLGNTIDPSDLNKIKANVSKITDHFKIRPAVAAAPAASSSAPPPAEYHPPYVPAASRDPDFVPDPVTLNEMVMHKDYLDAKDRGSPDQWGLLRDYKEAFYRRQAAGDDGL